MKEQSFANHVRLTPLYHFILAPLVLALLTGSILLAYRHYVNHSGLLIPALFVLVSLIAVILTALVRTYALKVQDRAIRAEENLRYFAVTGSLLDNRLTMSQIIALRFASPNELLDLAHKAAAEDMPAKDIKKAVKHWKGDYHRV